MPPHEPLVSAHTMQTHVQVGPGSLNIGGVGDKLRERAALVALLQLPGTRWAEITFEVLEADSALAVLERQLSGRDTLFPERGGSNPR